MAKSRWNIRPTVMRRTIQIMQSAGLQIGSVEIAPDGRLVITPKPETVIEAQPTDNRNEWSA
jgi:hypothetical protein